MRFYLQNWSIICNFVGLKTEKEKDETDIADYS